MGKLIERLLEDRVRLRSEHDQAAIEEEGRDGVDPDCVRIGGRPRNVIAVQIACDRRLRALEPELCRKRPKDLGVANVLAVFPVGLHEPLVRRGVLGLRSCQLGHAERCPRIRHHVGRRVVAESLPLERRLEALVEAIAVAAVELSPRNALRWVLGVEIEGEPLDLGAEPTLEPLSRALAEAAERSDVVRPDDDLVLGHEARLAARVF